MAYERVLGELVGEIILNPPALSGPQVLRPTVQAGLELLDASLHPDHIIRQTESLTLADEYVLRRSVELEIAGDAVGVSEKGWLPLLALPRPQEVPVDVYDANDNLLPGPRGSEVREALVAALVNLLSELPRADPGWTAHPEETPDDGLLLNERHIAERTLAAAVVSICRSGPRSAHAAQRRDLLDRRLAQASRKVKLPTPKHKGEPDDLPLGDLACIVAAERGPGRPSAKALALDLVLGQVRNNVGFLEVFDFVYSKHVVAARVAPGEIDHLLWVQLPDVDASRASRDRQGVRPWLRSLKVGDHNFTARIKVPVPPRIEQYRLQVTGSFDGDPDAGLGVVAVVCTEPPPIPTLVHELAECRDLYSGAARELAGGPAPTVVLRRRLAVLVHAATESRTIVARLSAAAETTFSATRDAVTRWKLGGARPRYGGFPYKDERPRRFRQAVNDVDRLLERTEDRARCIDAALSAYGSAGSSGRAIKRVPVALRGARTDIRALERVTGPAREALDRLGEWACDLNAHVTCEDSPGATTARVLVTQPPSAENRVPGGEVTLDVWVAVVDQGGYYSTSVLLIPVGTILLLGGFGFLIFENFAWLLHYPVAANDGRNGVLDRQADALAAVLLLIPSFFAGLRWRAVMGWLRRVPRIQGYMTVLVSAICAAFVAVEMGENTDPGDVARVLWAFRVSVGVFVVWCGWGLLASVLRRYVRWEPKGMEVAVVGSRRCLRTKRRSRGDGDQSRFRFRESHSHWLRRLFRSRHPNVSFDLTTGPLISAAPPRPSGRAARGAS